MLENYYQARKISWHVQTTFVDCISWTFRHFISKLAFVFWSYFVCFKLHPAPATWRYWLSNHGGPREKQHGCKRGTDSSPFFYEAREVSNGNILQLGYISDINVTDVILYSPPRYAVPDAPFSIPIKVTVENLSTLLNELLKGTHTSSFFLCPNYHSFPLIFRIPWTAVARNWIWFSNWWWISASFPFGPLESQRHQYRDNSWYWIYWKASSTRTGRQLKSWWLGVRCSLL